MEHSRGPREVSCRNTAAGRITLRSNFLRQAETWSAASRRKEATPKNSSALRAEKYMDLHSAEAQQTTSKKVLRTYNHTQRGTAVFSIWLKYACDVQEQRSTAGDPFAACTSTTAITCSRKSRKKGHYVTDGMTLSSLISYEHINVFDVFNKFHQRKYRCSFREVTGLDKTIQGSYCVTHCCTSC